VSQSVQYFPPAASSKFEVHPLLKCCFVDVVNPDRDMLLRPEGQECINQILAFDREERHFAGQVRRGRPSLAKDSTDWVKKYDRNGNHPHNGLDSQG
jgi:hypothetical protein